MTIELADHGPVDIAATLRTLRAGLDDPTWKIADGDVWYATHTPDGPASVHLYERGTELVAEGWGAGSDHLLEHVPELVGLHDQRADFDAALAASDHQGLARLVAAHPGFRLPRSRNLFEALVWAVAAQGVSNFEAHRAYRQLITARGADAPGPGGLRVLPDPSELAGMPNYELHTYGFEQERAHLLRQIAAQASHLNDLIDADADAARSALAGLDGLAPGSIELAVLCAHGDPDAVPTGDPRRTAQVGALLVGDRDVDEPRLLALLAAFPGHRGRVIRYAELAEIGQGGARPLDASR